MAPCAPDAELRAATTLVFVEDLDSLSLCEDDAHHLGEVLRLRPGEAVAAGDGAGAWRICSFTGPKASVRGRAGGAIDKASRFGLEVAGPVHRMERPLPMLEVGFSWAKAERTEWAVAKLVELGLDLLTPLMTDRTVVRPGWHGTTRREARLHKIVRAAAMQSRRPFLPEIGTSQSVDAVLGRSPASDIALAEPGGSPISLQTPIVLVGPEGGWSPRELALVDNKVSLGDGVLRVETAAMAAGVLLTALRSTAVTPPR
ncbi:MAG: RsmE family RNA methyltransferase [Acidimicrobiales bacterium]